MSLASRIDWPAAPNTRRWGVLEIIFGIVLPIACLLADLWLLRLAQYGPIALWGSAALGISALMLSHVDAPAVREVTRGMLVAASIIAAMVGVAVLPLTFMSLVFPVPIALLGLLPFSTAAAFYHRALTLDRPPLPKWPPRAIAGALLVVLLPAAAQYLEWRWIDTQTAAVYGADAAKREHALRVLATYPFGLDRTQRIACRYYLFTKDLDYESRSKAGKILGDLQKRCWAIAF